MTSIVRAPALRESVQRAKRPFVAIKPQKSERYIAPVSTATTPRFPEVAGHEGTGGEYRIMSSIRQSYVDIARSL